MATEVNRLPRQISVILESLEDEEDLAPVLYKKVTELILQIHDNETGTIQFIDAWKNLFRCVKSIIRLMRLNPKERSPKEKEFEPFRICRYVHLVWCNLRYRFPKNNPEVMKIFPYMFIEALKHYIKNQSTWNQLFIRRTFTDLMHISYYASDYIHCLSDVLEIHFFDILLDRNMCEQQYYSINMGMLYLLAHCPELYVSPIVRYRVITAVILVWDRVDEEIHPNPDRQMLYLFLLGSYKLMLNLNFKSLFNHLFNIRTNNYRDVNYFIPTFLYMSIQYINQNIFDPKKKYLTIYGKIIEVIINIIHLVICGGQVKLSLERDDSGICHLIVIAADLLINIKRGNDLTNGELIRKLSGKWEFQLILSKLFKAINQTCFVFFHCNDKPMMIQNDETLKMMLLLVYTKLKEDKDHYSLDYLMDVCSEVLDLDNHLSDLSEDEVFFLCEEKCTDVVNIRTLLDPIKENSYIRCLNESELFPHGADLFPHGADLYSLVPHDVQLHPHDGDIGYCESDYNLLVEVAMDFVSIMNKEINSRIRTEPRPVQHRYQVERREVEVDALDSLARLFEGASISLE